MNNEIRLLQERLDTHKSETAINKNDFPINTMFIGTLKDPANQSFCNLKIHLVFLL